MSNMAVVHQLALYVFLVQLQLVHAKYEAVSVQHLAAAVGDTITLPCDTSSDDAVDWTFKPAHQSEYYDICTGDKIHPNYGNRLQLVDGYHDLIIMRLGASDNGRYTCIEQGGLGPRHDVVLIVHERTPSIRNAVEGEVVALRCQPAVDEDVEWMRRTPGHNEDVVISAGSVISSKFNSRMSVHKSADGVYSLVINPVLSSDTGEYQCVEQNGLGETHASVLVVDDYHQTNQGINNTAWLLVLTVALTLLFVCFSYKHICKQRLPASLKRLWASKPEHVQHSAARESLLPRPPVVRTDQLVELPVQDIVHGVAYMEGRIYVVCWQYTRILVFDEDNQRLADLENKEFKQPRDIAACPESRCLYVADWTRQSGQVWKVPLDGVVTSIFPSDQSGEAVRPWSLSVTRSRLLITSMDDQLVLLERDGAEIRRLVLRENDIKHAVETSDETFVVCHFQPVNAVSLFDYDGNILGQYTDPSFATPMYMTPDSQGNLFISDYNSSRIIQINVADRVLQFRRVVLDRQHGRVAKKPWRLCYIDGSKRLLVGSDDSSSLGGEASNACLQVFDVDIGSDSTDNAEAELVEEPLL